ncbi:YceI family protein [Agrilutibacter solisilvae]|nr:YceI family protein [Lysobacter solisilvae]
MFNKLILTAALALAAGQAFAAPVSYKIDPNHTNVIATWDHFGFSKPSAHFGKADGTIVYDADNVGQSSVKVTLPLTGMTGFVADFDEHLRSKDFFKTDEFPDATFASTKVEAAGDNKLRVTGDLTLRGVTKPVVLDVTLNKAAAGRDGQPRIGFDAAATIKRSDFGLGLFAPKVSDEVALRITTEAGVPKAEAAPAK